MTTVYLTTDYQRKNGSFGGRFFFHYPILFRNFAHKKTTIMEQKFTVVIDGGYYYDDEEAEFDISLTDEEWATLERLVSEYDGDRSKGLFPILRKGPEALYRKFYDAIFPYVWYVHFQRDDLVELLPEDEGRDFSIKDVSYLMEKYDAYDLDDAYICRIPQELLHPTAAGDKPASH